MNSLSYSGYVSYYKVPSFWLLWKWPPCRAVSGNVLRLNQHVHRCPETQMRQRFGIKSKQPWEGTKGFKYMCNFTRQKFVFNGLINSWIRTLDPAIKKQHIFATQGISCYKQLKGTVSSVLNAHSQRLYRQAQWYISK